ncbi:MAG: hypothetical protein IK079_05530, partial [Desulfovibrio sp.]|nr:hypothetical protein [Desulfovibrio sp.]
VVGIGGVHNGGATPLLLFDEHPSHDSSSLALVTKTLFGRRHLPKSLFLLIQEIDLIDACGGAHPKHLSSYINRLHDFAQQISSLQNTDLPNAKAALIDSYLITMLWAKNEQIPYFDPKFWLPKAQLSLEEAAQHASFANREDFQPTVDDILQKIQKLRQPYFKNQNKNLIFHPKAKVYQSLLVPYLTALTPLLWGEKIASFCNDILWQIRILSQMHYNIALKTLNPTLGSSPKPGTYSTPIGDIELLKINDLWILDIHQNKTMGSIRQSLISYMNQYLNSNGYLILRNSEINNVILSMGKATSMEQWNKLVQFLVAEEGSTDTDPPGCWHVVRNAKGDLADFILNGNAAHSYVPKSKLTAERLAAWLTNQ